MFVCTLIADPKTAPLEAALTEALRNAWGGGEIRWLSPDEAVEFPIPARPDVDPEVIADVRGRQVDLVLQPAEGRRKRVLIADMDSTMIREECIDELAEEAGFGEKVRAITARAMNGEIDFDGAVRERVGLLRGLDLSVIDDVLRDRIHYTPGGDVLLATMKANGAYTALVSGGFTMFTEAVAAHLGFDENRANTLIAQDGQLTGEVADPILGRDAKVTALEEITARLGLGDADVMAVGDGANDLGMLGRAGTGVALHAKPAVAEQCDVRLDFSDLSALLYLQGYAKTDFVMR